MVYCQYHTVIPSREKKFYYIKLVQGFEKARTRHPLNLKSNYNIFVLIWGNKIWSLKCLIKTSLEIFVCISVSDGTDLELRLVGGSNRCAGRVELKVQGKWGTICHHNWNNVAANVVCKQLGCGTALHFPGLPHFESGSGTIWLDDVSCSGNESFLWDCRHSGRVHYNCIHQKDVAVICSGKTHISMVRQIKYLFWRNRNKP